jgi:hypothetical protein
MRKIQKDEEEEEKKFKQIIQSNNNIPSQTIRNQSAQIKDKSNTEDEPEIPAFIRKKMGI